MSTLIIFIVGCIIAGGFSIWAGNALYKERPVACAVRICCALFIVFLTLFFAGPLPIN